ncbi:MAG: FliA/WhiG family RNA polymerase sigma factor [Planctomycetes bacterium]|nr:FliA/WhiG family RNA polymerase sigma factor [Planctomycetota bacterium]
MKIVDTDLTDVWTEYKTAPTEAVRNQLVERYLPIVRFVAERLATTLPSFVEVDDLASMGIFGLLDAIERFDPKMGVKFKTYAMNRIRGSILDELRSLDWVPRLVRIKATKMDRACRELEAELGRQPTFFEMSQRLGMGFDEYHSMIEGGSATGIISLSEEWADQEDNHGNSKIDLLEDDNPTGTPMHEMQLKDIREVIANHLTEKERIIVTLYYYEGLSMKEIAKVLNLTESRICQIHGKVVERLKEQLDRSKANLFM